MAKRRVSVRVTGAMVIVLTSFERGAVPDEPDYDEYEEEAEYVAEYDHNEPHAVVLRSGIDGYRLRWRGESVNCRR